MGKYDPLRDHLKRQEADDFEFTFAEIERKSGTMLPNGVFRPQSWAITTLLHFGHVQREAWRAAGSSAFLISGQDNVRSRRLA